MGVPQGRRTVRLSRAAVKRILASWPSSITYRAYAPLLTLSFLTALPVMLTGGSAKRSHCGTTNTCSMTYAPSWDLGRLVEGVPVCSA
eukprot:306699-Chlamydomonas_euryale.AAC.1